MILCQFDTCKKVLHWHAWTLSSDSPSDLAHEERGHGSYISGVSGNWAIWQQRRREDHPTGFMWHMALWTCAQIKELCVSMQTGTQIPWRWQNRYQQRILLQNAF